MDLFKAPRFSYQKRFHNKGHLNFCFWAGVFNRVYVTISKSSSSERVTKCELIVFLFLKVALKATDVKSDS